MKKHVLGTDIEQGSGISTPFEAVVYDEAFRQNCLDIIKPSLLTDVKEMTRGRARWRRASVVSETLGKLASATATVLAFAAASDLAGGEASRIIGFTSGTVGTVSMVLVLFANFSRTQSIERSDALNLILEHAKIETIPEIASELVVNGDEVFGSSGEQDT
jgi:hypothetical protein